MFYISERGHGEAAEGLLECLWEEEALLHVVMADSGGINVTDAREARLHSAMLLQRLIGITRLGYIWIKWKQAFTRASINMVITYHTHLIAAPCAALIMAFV